ncbi:GIY-YIG nuclease family protein [Pedobacter sp. GR22-10]|uniref:GIY-YIG nuclease family protein n=1 Tax=Pedobacter sp. GR22-10 TaxID=2994472 RepID=UPI0022463147|nr:GIY-YIG nuclease family protein [Pedobacter sp. GR22-10]MCX2432183.1 hypothetical protein [Pedobacter sp. GR22-10]
MAEQLGFYTIDPIELQKHTNDPNPILAVKSSRGIIYAPMLKYLDCYEHIFWDMLQAIPTSENNFIYLMFNSKTKLIKIGKSKKPQYGEKTLQSEEPEITMIAVWEANAQTETSLHQKCKDKYICGEWFKLTLKDMAAIKDNKDTEKASLADSIPNSTTNPFSEIFFERIYSLILIVSCCMFLLLRFNQLFLLIPFPIILDCWYNDSCYERNYAP